MNNIFFSCHFRDPFDGDIEALREDEALYGKNEPQGNESVFIS